MVPRYGGKLVRHILDATKKLKVYHYTVLVPPGGSCTTVCILVAVCGTQQGPS